MPNEKNGFIQITSAFIIRWTRYLGHVQQFIMLSEQLLLSVQVADGCPTPQCDDITAASGVQSCTSGLEISGRTSGQLRSQLIRTQ